MEQIIKLKWLPLVGLLLMLSSLDLSAQDEESRTTTFTFGGYAKADLILSNFGNGMPDISNPVRDIYLPGLIPVGDDRSEFDTQIMAKESRFFFDVRTTLLNKPVKAYVELDFLLSKAGDQRISNSYNPRMRHFYFQWGKFLFGQTWTTFMTVSGIPDGTIFVPGSEGLVFIRQAMFRFSHDGWDFALENPETEITQYQEGGSFDITSGGIPDVVVKKTFNGDFGQVGLAAMYRFLLYEDETTERYNKSGFGLSIGGHVNVDERDKLRFMMTYGQGLGRYVGFAFTTSSILDENNAPDLPRRPCRATLPGIVPVTSGLW